MRSVVLSGAVTKLRRSVSGSSCVQDGDVTDKAKLAETIRLLSKRVSDLESGMPAVGVEIEKTVDGAGTATNRFFHGFGKSVRWWPVYWKPTTPGDAVNLSWTTSSTDNELVLASGKAGRVILRVEPSDVALSI